NAVFQECPNIFAKQMMTLSETLVFSETTYSGTTTFKWKNLNKVINPNDCTIINDLPDVEENENTATWSSGYTLTGNIVHHTPEDYYVAISFSEPNIMYFMGKTYHKQ